jgi:hypothetical protein
MMAPSERAQLDEQLRAVIRAGLSAGATAEELLFLLTRMLPELALATVGAGAQALATAHIVVQGHVDAAFAIVSTERASS